MHRIIRIHVRHMYESCQRHSYYVVGTTDEGMTKEVECHRTGSLYNDFAGLSREKARDRALIDAAEWRDFLALPEEGFVEEGILHEPSMTFDTYTMARDQKTLK